MVDLKYNIHAQQFGEAISNQDSVKPDKISATNRTNPSTPFPGAI